MKMIFYLLIMACVPCFKLTVLFWPVQVSCTLKEKGLIRFQALKNKLYTSQKKETLVYHHMTQKQEVS